MTDKLNLIIKILFIIIFFAGNSIASQVPLTTDSRIKTFIYSENEVFRMKIHYGFQSSIEFGKNEEIETLSVGNSYSWKFSPIGRRLFIKALEGAAYTNMTVITNKRTYQFELESKVADNNLDAELVYVVRFYYPDENLDAPVAKVATENFIPKSTNNVGITPALPIIQPVQPFNYNYTLSGPESIAPVKIFDDGSKIYLKFNNNSAIPHIFAVDETGNYRRLFYSVEGEYITIKEVPAKIALKLNSAEVFVYNESKLIQ